MKSMYIATGFVNGEREPTSWALTRHWVGGLVSVVVTAPTTGKLGIIVFFFMYFCEKFSIHRLGCFVCCIMFPIYIPTRFSSLLGTRYDNTILCNFILLSAAHHIVRNPFITLHVLCYLYV